MPKRPVTLYLDADTYERCRRLLRMIPVDLTVSPLVDRFLLQFVDEIEPVINRIMEGDKEAAYDLMRMFAGRSVEDLGSQMRDIRTLMEDESKKEVST